MRKHHPIAGHIFRFRIYDTGEWRTQHLNRFRISDHILFPTKKSGIISLSCTRRENTVDLLGKNWKIIWIRRRKKLDLFFPWEHLSWRHSKLTISIFVSLRHFKVFTPTLSLFNFTFSLCHFLFITDRVSGCLSGQKSFLLLSSS